MNSNLRRKFLSRHITIVKFLAKESSLHRWESV